MINNVSRDLINDSLEKSPFSKDHFTKLKLHPFDFNGQDLAEIKKIFPEFKPKRSTTRVSSKVIGLTLIDLKKKLKEMIHLEGKPLLKLIQKLDHKNEDKITWSEFLTFLENEGAKREIVNDAQIYGMGIKRIEEGQRINLHIADKVVEYYIDGLCYMQHKQFKLILALFENNAAKILDGDTFEIIQDLQFTSDYSVPKQNQHQPSNQIIKMAGISQHSRMTLSRKSKTPNLSVNRSSQRKSVSLVKNLSNHPFRIVEGVNNEETFKTDLLIDDKSEDHSHIIDIQGIHFTKPQKQQNLGSRRASFKINKIPDQHTSKKPSIDQRAQQQQSHYHSVMIEDLTNQDLSPYREQKNQSALAKSYHINQNSRNLPQTQTTASQSYGLMLNKASSSFQTTHEKRKRLQSAQIDDRQTHQSTINITNKSRINIQRKKKMYGVLGITKLVEDDDDLIPKGNIGNNSMIQDSSRPFGMRELFPNLQQDHDASKKRFVQLMSQMDKQIKYGEVQLQQRAVGVAFTNQLSRMGTKISMKTNTESINQSDWEPNTKSKITNQLNTVIMSNEEKKRKEKQDQFKQLQTKLIAKQKKVYTKIDGIKDKIEGQDKKLDELRETNQHFFKLTSNQSIHVKSYQQTYNHPHLKDEKSLQMRTSSTENPHQEINKKDIFENPYSTMTTKQSSPSKNAMSTQQKLGGGIQQESGDQNKKSKVKLTKEVYSVCADFHQDTSTLVIALIDREMKIYKLKQNGQKITIVENFSFQSKFMVACMHIDQFAVNNRSILCLGGHQGEVAVYYIDEPIDPEESLLKKHFNPNEIGKVKQLLHKYFNFFTRGKEESPKKGLGQSTQQDTSTIGQISQEDNYETNNTEKIQAEAQRKSIFQPSYLAHQPIENELTCIKYIKDIGLIVTALNGTFKIFDAFDFKIVWKSSNKSRKQNYHTNIVTFDVSAPLGLMATGGVEGKLILIDPFALGIINSIIAHSSEILQLYIYDEQQQIITIAQDRSIALWDAYRLEKIQYITDNIGTHTPKFTSATFDKQSGKLYTGCQSLKVWEAKVDPSVEIKALQVETLSKTILKERKITDTTVRGISKGGKNKNGAIEQKTGKVLVTNSSELVDIVINEKDDMNFLITVDSENLLRAWAIKSSATSFSYKIPMEKRVTAVAIDPTCQYLAIGNCDGEAQILNLKSGGILYQLPHSDSEITCLQFLSGMSEFWLVGGCWQGKLMMWTNPNEYNNFNLNAKCRIGHKHDVLAIECSANYIVSGGVDGLVSVWNTFSGVLKYAITLPPPSYTDVRRMDDKYEELMEDSSDNDGGATQGGQTNKGGEDSKMDKKSIFSSPKTSVKFHQTNTTVRSNQPEIQVDSAASLKKNVVGICFHPSYPNQVCVMQEGGDIHIVDVSNGTVSHEYVAKAKMNSNWACDRQNQKLFVVGDVGRACLFDMSVMAAMLRRKFARALNFSSATQGGQQLAHLTNQIGNQLVSNLGFSPSKRESNLVLSPSKQLSGKQDVKWEMVKPWFTAHHIHKMEPTYVVSVKFAVSVKIYVTGTSKGEVKLWSTQCEVLGVLNSSNWEPSKVLQVIYDANREEKKKEFKNDEIKKRESRIRSINQLLKVI